MSTDAQIAANRANAQHSTGPVTDAGKAASCQNNFRHGMAGAFRVLPSEDQDEFDCLAAALRAEHQPATPTESLLVEKMAQHYWLSQRAQRLQDLTMADDLPAKDQDRQFSLFLRYQTTNDRAFHKSLNDLLKLRAEKRKMEIGFESQRQKQASLALRQSAENRRQELHKWAVMLAEAKLDHRLDEAARSQRAEDVTRVLTNDRELDQILAANPELRARNRKNAA
ncbi:MAG: hypothetical protein JO340_17750 [Acidobacteriaceae bacterium]|nr:hypothetical protein [Acidobacteriaceae bacterium]